LRKINFVATAFAIFILAQVPNLLHALSFPWLDPGDNIAMRIWMLMVCAILMLFAIFWTASPKKTEGDPRRPGGYGWFEAVSSITLVLSTAIMLCWEMDPNRGNRPIWIFWVVPAGIAVGSLVIEWPLERKKRYEELSKWIWHRLITKGSVNIWEAIRHFVPVSDPTLHTSAKEAGQNERVEEYKYLIEWFRKENKELGVEIRDGQLVWRPPPRAGDQPITIKLPPIK